jgi:hypothetical protein
MGQILGINSSDKCVYQALCRFFQTAQKRYSKCNQELAMQNEPLLKKDFSDMIKIFLEEQVQFLLVGGISINLYGYVRATKDMDLWIQASKENLCLVLSKLISGYYYQSQTNRFAFEV